MHTQDSGPPNSKVDLANKGDTRRFVPKGNDGHAAQRVNHVVIKQSNPRMTPRDGNHENRVQKALMRSVYSMTRGTISRLAN